VAVYPFFRGFFVFSHTPITLRCRVPHGLSASAELALRSGASSGQPHHFGETLTDSVITGVVSPESRLNGRVSCRFPRRSGSSLVAAQVLPPSSAREQFARRHTLERLPSMIRSFSAIRRVACVLASVAALAICGSTASAVPVTGNVSFQNGSTIVIGTSFLFPFSINSATSFQTTALTTSTAGGSLTGDFIGLPATIIDTSVFDPSVGNSLTISDAGNVFGSFTSTAIVDYVNTLGTRTFAVTGIFTPGTFFSDPTPQTAAVGITYLQIPPNTGFIVSVGSMTVPAVFVPEPSTFAFAGIGLAGLVGLDVRRRRMAAK
jgi:hypothetical protein